jgi:hypothetical protein
MSSNKLKRVHDCVLIKFIIQINLFLKPHLFWFKYMYIDYNDIYIILEKLWKCNKEIQKKDLVRQ